MLAIVVSMNRSCARGKKNAPEKCTFSYCLDYVTFSN